MGVMTPPAIEVDGLDVTYVGEASPTLANVSFGVARGEIVALVGPSGSGKSTLLRTLAGVLRASAGSIRSGGHQVQGPARDRVLVSQRPALFPWRTAATNVGFGLELAGIEKKKRTQEVDAMLAAVGLSDSAALYPHQLSGGMQQRVALARAMLVRPELLLMDEPFGALDAFTRVSMQDLLLELQQRNGTTIILVTHDLVEAIRLSERVLVLNGHPATVTHEFAVNLPFPRTSDVDWPPRVRAIRTDILRILKAAGLPRSDLSAEPAAF